MTGVIMAVVGVSEFVAMLLGVVSVIVVLAVVGWWRRGASHRKGREGEKLVAAELRRLGKSRALVMNDVVLPGIGNKSATCQIDHVVISRYGIFVVETKSHAGRIAGSEQGQYWTQHLGSQSNRMYNPLLQNAAHINRLRRLLPELEGDLFVSMVVFTQAWRLEIRTDDIVEERWLRSPRHVARTLRPSERRKGRWWSRKGEVVLDESCVVLSVGEIAGEITRRPKVLGAEDLEWIRARIEEGSVHGRGVVCGHREYARSRARENERLIRSGVCPRCGGRLTLRRGECGEFAGCENYPDCRFTCSIDLYHG